MNNTIKKKSKCRLSWGLAREASLELIKCQTPNHIYKSNLEREKFLLWNVKSSYKEKLGEKPRNRKYIYTDINTHVFTPSPPPFFDKRNKAKGKAQFLRVHPFTMSM